VEYKRAGWTLEQIMVAESYGSLQATSKAVNNALNRIKSPTVNAIRATSDATNDYIRRVMTDIISNPPPVHSAIGKLVPNPDTCTCPNRLSPTMDGHHSDCRVQPVRDMARVIAAAEVIRKTDYENRRLHGADRPQKISLFDESMREATEHLRSLFGPQWRPSTVTAEVIRELEDGSDETPAGTDLDD
jgi:hypothetical protein